MKVKRRRHIPKGVVILGAVILVALAAFGTMKLLSNSQHEVTTPQTSQEKPTPKPVSVEANTLFVGDIYLGRMVNQWAISSDLKMAHPFSRLSEFQHDSYDAWIGNLECPTVAGDTPTPAQEEATLSFNCNPDYLTEAAKWFSAVSLANNHTDNRGAEGFAETQEQLDKAGIQYFGHYDPREADDACDVIALPVTVTHSDQSTKKEHLPVAMCGHHGVFRIPPDSTLQLMEEYSKYMPVIAMPHMGAEYQAGPDQIKTDTYRKMIDYGADMVLGGHPHWVQSTEAYKGKLIVYSMGNFIFDQLFNTEVTRSASIRVVMKTTDTSESQLTQWLQLGEACKSYHDDCLAQAAAKNLTKLNLTYQYGVVAGSSADKVTKPATAAQRNAILQRLNWQTTMNQLQAPQSAL